MHKNVRSLLSPPHFGDLNLIRRKSCYCSECGEMAPKEPLMGNQKCEIANHKKKQAVVKVIKRQGTKEVRQQKAKLTIRQFAKNPLIFALRSRPDYKEKNYIPETPSPTRPTSPIFEQPKTMKFVKTHQVKNFFLNDLKSKMNRQQKTLQCIMTSKSKDKLHKTFQTFQTITIKKDFPNNTTREKLTPFSSFVKKVFQNPYKLPSLQRVLSK